MSARLAPKRLPPQLRQPSTTRAMMLEMMVALTPKIGRASCRERVFSWV